MARLNHASDVFAPIAALSATLQIMVTVEVDCIRFVARTPNLTILTWSIYLHLSLKWTVITRQPKNGGCIIATVG
jgi:hypothetical protein